MRYSVLGATVEQVKAIGGKDVRQSRTGIVFATLTEAQAAQLRRSGVSVTPVSKISPAVVPPISPPAPVAGAPTYTPEQLVVGAGFDQIRDLTVPPLYGENFNLAIIDSGIRESHQAIAGRVVHRANMTSDPMEDGFDHGTGVASVALAVAPRCNLINIKALDNKGEGTEEDVVMGIDEVLSLHDAGSEYAPHVVNLSLGGPDDGNPNNPLRVACRVLLEQDIWVIAAAGNGGPELQTIMSPACERYVAAVGSVGYQPFDVSQFSSRGPTVEGLVKPDVVLFGENISLASSAGDTATVAKSGTSFAAPFASGMVILYYQAILVHGARYSKEQAPSDIYHQLLEMLTPQQMMDYGLPRVSVKPQGASAGKDNSYGWGLPYGPLVTQAITGPTMNLSTLLMPVLLVGMMGMMVKVIK